MKVKEKETKTWKRADSCDLENVLGLSQKSKLGVPKVWLAGSTLPRVKAQALGLGIKLFYLHALFPEKDLRINEHDEIR